VKLVDAIGGTGRPNIAAGQAVDIGPGGCRGGVDDRCIAGSTAKHGGATRRDRSRYVNRRGPRVAESGGGRKDLVNRALIPGDGQVTGSVYGDTS
jgi:hypothetical protein